ncbi:MAG: hypothetical protein JWN14_2838 [Chthonomonadales bacterium]|nr:hypothetical protein [Chthonomonadales bacterium]
MISRILTYLKYLCPLAMLAFLLTSSATLATSQGFSTVSLHIFLYENGIAVDETALYSYAEPHLISRATQQTVGATILGDPVTLYDTTGQQTIGYIAYVSDDEQPDTVL